MAIGARDTSSRGGTLGLGAVITRGDNKLGRQYESAFQNYGDRPWAVAHRCHAFDDSLDRRA
jgi:hypothetical protein